MGHLQQLDARSLMGFGFAAKNNTLRIFVGVTVNFRFGLSMIDSALRAIEVAFFPERFSLSSSVSYIPEEAKKVIYRNSGGKIMVPLEPFPTDWIP
jgi:hypothetical protein